MKKRYQRLQTVCIVIVVLALVFASTLLCGYFFVRKNINYSADEELFRHASAFESTVFYGMDYSKDKELVALKDESGEILKKSYSPLEEIPTTLKEGFIAVEDRNFSVHSGVDYKRTAYAAFNYFFGKEKRFGASTITQQVVKNISGDNEVTVGRKISEILRALHIEKSFSKEEILELYLNIVPMSGNIYGVSEAARNFFGKEVSSLSVAECATLIGITNAPTAYSPYKNPEKCLAKRNLVLDTLFSEGVIDNKEYITAKGTPLGVIPESEQNDRYYSWFIEGVIDSVSSDLAEKYGINQAAARLMLLSGGYSVYTTMDVKAQTVLENYFENDELFMRAEALGADYSMVILDSENSNMLALIGGAGKKEGNRLLNHAFVPHIPASSLKPIAIYAPLIDEGVINYATVIDDTPVGFHEDNGEYRPYPKNSPNVYDGLTTVKDAIRLSKNTVAVKLCKSRGAEAVYNFLKNKMGIDSLVYKETKDGRTLTDVDIAPMALGQLTRGIPLVKLTECYAAFPSGGVLNKARNYICVKDYEGNTVLKSEEEHRRVFSQETAGIMNQLLSAVVNDGTAKSIKLKELVATAGKTGTSSANKDKMFIGYTPYFTAGIWCGSEKNSVSGLAPSVLSVWDDIMITIHEELLNKGELRSFDTDGLIYAPYCKDSGKLYSESCMLDPRGNRMEYGYFTKDNMPVTSCDRHITVYYDTVYKGISVGKCPRADLAEISLIKVNDRSFPSQIYITDAEYVYRDINQNDKIPNTDELPYFYYSLPEGVYCGITNRKKQFNSACKNHERLLIFK